MPSFAYTARETSTGREIRSSVESINEQTAIAALLNRNLLVVSIQEKIAKKGKMQGGKVALADLVVFTRQLATMIDAGIAIVQALQALAEQTPNKVMRDVIRDVCSRVESGESFSEALQKHPKTFNRLYYSMISAGEKGGLLAEIMARLATYLENTERLRKKVKTALMYPTVVTVVAIVITIFLLVRVIPTFKEVYQGFGAAFVMPATLSIITAGHVVLPLWTWHGQPQGFTQQGLYSAGLIITRVATSISLVVLLTLTTPWVRLLAALRSIGVPRIFVLVIGMAYRYLFLLLDTVDAMYTARKARTGEFTPPGVTADARSNRV